MVVKNGCGRQVPGGLLIREQFNSKRSGPAGEPVKDVGGVRTFRVCNNTGFFHTVIVATTGRAHKIYSRGNGHCK